MFNIKFILLIIGLFLFVIGYVNQNKYNCNISPSIDKKIEQNLKDLFYDKNILLDSDRKNIDYDISGKQIIYDTTKSGIYESRDERQLAEDLGVYISNTNNAPGYSVR